jgi:hypothetical protein
MTKFFIFLHEISKKYATMVALYLNMRIGIFGDIALPYNAAVQEELQERDGMSLLVLRMSASKRPMRTMIRSSWQVV